MADWLDAEIAARETQPAVPPSPSWLDTEIASRPTPPAGSAIGDTPQTAPSSPVSPFAAPGLAFTDSLAAMAQNTSPIVRGIDGKLNYDVAPDEEQSIYNQTGMPRNQQTHVVLRDPADNTMKVFGRNPDMEEGRLTSLGRLLGFGTMAGPLNVGSRILAGSGATTKLLQDFDRVGVDPNLPALAQNPVVSLGTNLAAKVPLVSGPIQSGTDRMTTQLAGAADRVADSYGAAKTPYEAGNAVQQGITDFAKGDGPNGLTQSETIAAPSRATSVADKSGALYDRVSSLVPADTKVELTNTLDALKGPVDRFPTMPDLGGSITAPKLQQLYSIAKPQTVEIPAVLSSMVDQYGSPIVKQAAQTIQKGGSLTMPEASEFRSFIGRQLGDGSLVSDIPRSDLKSVYGALSKDIGAAVDATGNPAAKQAYSQANTYYKAAMDRVDQIEGLLGKSPEGAIASINTAAGKGAGADLGKLTALQRSMAPEEWGNVGSAVIRRLGEPTAGAANPLGTNFSASSFVTNWSKLTPQARDVLFGNGPQRQALESLVNVAAAKKGLDAVRNTSESATTGGLAAIGGAFAVAPVSTTLGLLTGRVAASAMMNPSFTRWVSSLPSPATMAGATSLGGAWVAPKLAQLDALAQMSPELKPVAAQLRAGLLPAAAHP